jgi:TatD DNase family protein
VVAIGECGLDNFRPVVVTDDVKHRQKEVLRAQIALAGALKKPLIIHSRPAKGTMDAYHDLTDILKDAKNTYPALCGDIHFFVGGIPEMQALTSLDFTVSFTAVITFARDYDDVIRATPLTSILSETDAPYVAPLRRRGTKNDPLTTIEVVAKIAEIRNEPLELVQATLCATATRLFALK